MWKWLGWSTAVSAMMVLAAVLGEAIIDLRETQVKATPPSAMRCLTVEQLRIRTVTTFTRDGAIIYTENGAYIVTNGLIVAAEEGK